MSDGSKFSFFPIDITFCGNEQLTTNEMSALDIVNPYEMGSDSNITLSYEQIRDFFSFSIDPSTSHADCDTTDSFDLCDAEDCSNQPWTHTDKAELVAYTDTGIAYFYLHIKNDIQYLETGVWLQKKTKGDVTAVKHLKLEVCGLEQVLS